MSTKLLTQAGFHWWLKLAYILLQICFCSQSPSSAIFKTLTHHNFLSLVRLLINCVILEPLCNKYGFQWLLLNMWFTEVREGTWHCNCLCYTGRSNETPFQHITQSVLHDVSRWHWLHRAWLGKPNCPGILEETMSWPKAGILEHCLRRWLMPKVHHHVMSYEKMQEAMLHLLMGPAVVGNHWKAAQDKSLRPLKQKVSQASLWKQKPSNYP